LETLIQTISGPHLVILSRSCNAAIGTFRRIRPALRRLLRCGSIAALVTVFAACGPAPRDLTELTVRDSIYLEPASLEPYSGPVFRGFPDGPDGVQLEGHLLRGVWNGEIRVYHPNGNIRYMGSFRNGERCGPWTENADSVPLGDIYDAVVREVETLGLYPPCDDDSID